MDLADLATGLLLLAAAVLVAHLGGAVTGIVWCLGLAGVTWFAPEVMTGMPAVDSALDSVSHLHLGLLAAAALVASGWRRAPLWGAALVASSWVLTGRPDVWLVGWEVLVLAALVGLLRGSAGRTRIWAACGVASAALAPLVGLAVSGWATPLMAAWAAPSVYELLVMLSAVSVVMAVRASRGVGGDVADAVIRITAGESGVARQLLAEAMADPSVDVAVRVPGGWADEQGRPRPDLVAGRGRVVIPVVVDGDVVARISCAEHVALRPQVLSAIDAAGALASANADLRNRLAVQSGLLEQARRRLVVMEDEQRGRLSHRLLTDTRATVDEIGSRLTQAQASVAGSPELAAALRSARMQHEAVAQQLHQLANGLAPNVEMGLRSAVVDTAQRLGLVLEVDVPEDAPPEVRQTLYFVCMEALSNVVKHAGTDRARVVCHLSDDAVTLVVSDRGRGGATPAEGSGLQGMADRVSALGGSFSVQSPPGKGTDVVVRLPLRAATTPAPAPRQRV